jgi:hypothetical protein
MTREYLAERLFQSGRPGAPANPAMCPGYFVLQVKMRGLNLPDVMVAEVTLHTSGCEHPGPGAIMLSAGAWTAVVKPEAVVRHLPLEHL